MKKVFLTAVLLSWLSFVFAQSYQPIPQQLRHVLAPLDKTAVHSGILIDQSLNLLPLSQFDGTLNDSNYVNPNLFGMAYGQLRNGNTLPYSSLPAPSAYLSKIKRIQGQDTIPIAFLAMSYQELREDAVTENLITFNGQQFFDVPGRAATPYQTDTVWMITPLLENSKGSNVIFHFPQSLLFTNLGGTNPEIAFDAGDGLGWRNVMPGDAITVSYPEGGTHTLSFRLDYSGTVRLVRASFKTADAAAAKTRSMAWPRELVDVIPVTASKPYLGQAGTGQMSIFYNTSNCNSLKRLHRPLIIIEGFEIEGLLENDPNVMFGKLNAIVLNSGNNNLTDYLYPYEYDLIYVDFDKGDDYIQRNAFLLEEIIGIVNQMKAEAGSTEENVIIGVSMGGMASMYALKDMEKNGEDHDTRLFISYDSPLQGANIPVSVQCLLKFLKDNVEDLESQDLAIPDIDRFWDVIQQPTPRQLLHYHVNALAFSSPVPGLEPVNPEKIIFFNELNAFEPLKIRHVAISNGSGNGTFLEHDYAAGEPLFNFLATIKKSASKVKVKVVLNATGNNVPTKVLDANIKIFVLGFLVSTISWDPIVFTKPLDVGPGGTSELGMLPFKALLGALNAADIEPDEPIFIGKHHCFIPSFSGVNASMPGNFGGPQGCGLVDRCSLNETPTESVHFPGLKEINQDHVQIDTRIAELIIDELITIPGNPPPQRILSNIPNGQLNTYFNIGNWPQDAVPSLDILPGTGRLSINNSGRINFATPADPETQILDLSAHTICNAIINVENTAKLYIGDENGERSGGLYITDGSIVRLKTGSQLKVFAKSRLVVQSGATLIIEPGAEITLRDAPNGAMSTEGRPKITVEPGGKLQILGNFNFKGDGYFEFNPGHLTELPASFSFTGSGKTYRNIKLNRNAVLVKKGGSLNLLSTRVVFERDASIKAEGFNRVVLQQATFEPDAAKGYPVSDQQMALQAQGGQQVFVVGCDFKDFKNSLRLYDVNNYIRFSESNFENTVGAHVYNGKNVVLNGVEGQESSFFFDKISTGVTMRNSSLKGSYLGLSNGHSYNEMIKLRDVKMFVMEGGVLSGDEGGYNGIDASEGQNNIVLSNGATIEKTLYGVVMEGIYANNHAQASPDYGLLRMDCARILDCVGAGVHGTDILLDIDAGVNSNGMRPNEFRANAALVGSGTLGLIFDICYISRTPSEISANYNFWNVYGPGGNSVGPTPDMYSLYRRNPNANNCNWNAIAVPLTTNFVASGYDSSCPGKGGDGGFAGDIQSRGGLTYKDCFVGNQALYQQFTNAWSAWEASHELAVEADAEPDYTTALASFLGISQIDSVTLSPLASQCRHYNAVARTFIKAADKQMQQQVQQPLEQRVHTITAQELARVSPNPATEGFHLSLPEGNNWDIRISDVNGKVRLLSSTLAQQYVSTQDWSAGIYTIYYIDRTDSNRQGQVRVLVQ